MNEYTTVNILDMIDVIGEDKVVRVLSDFSCPKNQEIECFIRNNAINFAKRKMSVTHLVMNGDNKLVAIFTLAHKALEISNEGLSSAARRKIKRYAQLDESRNSYMISAFLVAQFGKNNPDSSDNISGNELMDNVIEVLERVQRDVGGGVMYLECEDKPKLLTFYENERNRFRVFSERYSETDQTKYIQLMRFF